MASQLVIAPEVAYRPISRIGCAQLFSIGIMKPTTINATEIKFVARLLFILAMHSSKVKFRRTENCNLKSLMVNVKSYLNSLKQGVIMGSFDAMDVGTT